jgi:cardiolipin synthase
VRASDLPNLLTLLRMVLVPAIVWLLLHGFYAEALWVFLFAGVSDGLDGFLARRMNWRSRLGSILDPLADKLLLIASYFTLAWIGLVPDWLLAAVLLRDFIIVVGGLAYHRHFGPFDMEPTYVSKINTFAQISLVLLLVAHQAFLFLPAHWITAGHYVVLTTTLLSGMDYVWTWGLRAWRHEHDAEESRG